MPLKAQLDQCRDAFAASADPALVAALRESIHRLSETGVTGRAVKAGEMAPPFRLRDQTGRFVTLSDLLKRGPVVLSFFRGEWCAYCALELRALADAHPDIAHLGASVVALSPYTREGASPAREHREPPFPILKDPEVRTARRYRIGYTVPRPFRAAYLALGFPKPATCRSDAWRLPIPGTYVVNTSGLVVLSYVDADHTTRLEPSEIIRALTLLRSA